jgi:hypothetical protein
VKVEDNIQEQVVSYQSPTHQRFEKSDATQKYVGSLPKILFFFIHTFSLYCCYEKCCVQCVQGKIFTLDTLPQVKRCYLTRVVVVCPMCPIKNKISLTRKKVYYYQMKFLIGHIGHIGHPSKKKQVFSRERVSNLTFPGWTHWTQRQQHTITTRNEQTKKVSFYSL